MQRKSIFVVVLALVLGSAAISCDGGGGGGNNVVDAEKVAAQAMAIVFAEGLNIGDAALMMNQSPPPGENNLQAFSSLPKALQIFKALSTITTGNFICNKNAALSDEATQQNGMPTTVNDCICAAGGSAVLTQIQTLKEKIPCQSCPFLNANRIEGNVSMVLNDCVVPSCGTTAQLRGEMAGSFVYNQDCGGIQDITGRIDTAESCSGVTANVDGTDVPVGTGTTVTSNVNGPGVPDTNAEGSVCTGNPTTQQNTDLMFTGIDDLFAKAACPACNNIANLDGKHFTEVFNCSTTNIDFCPPFVICGDCKNPSEIEFVKTGEDPSNGSVTYQTDDGDRTGVLCGSRFNWTLRVTDGSPYTENGIWNFSDENNFTGSSSYFFDNGGGGACTTAGRLTSLGLQGVEPAAISYAGQPICPGPNEPCNGGGGCNGASCSNDSNCCVDAPTCFGGICVP